jgi:hypothetical protein
MLPTLGQLKRLFPADEKSQAKALSSWLSYGFGIGTQTLVEQNEAVRTASKQLGSKVPKAGTAEKEKARHVPVEPRTYGIRPPGKDAPRNAIIAGTQDAKRYGS